VNRAVNYVVLIVSCLSLGVMLGIVEGEKLAGNPTPYSHNCEVQRMDGTPNRVPETR
jgi:hypothetical protein